MNGQIMKPSFHWIMLSKLDVATSLGFNSDITNDVLGFSEIALGDLPENSRIRVNVLRLSRNDKGDMISVLTKNTQKKSSDLDQTWSSCQKS